MELHTTGCQIHQSQTVQKEELTSKVMLTQNEASPLQK